MLIAAIDVGYNNLGIVVAEVTDYEIKTICFCKRVNISEYRCRDENCKVPHTREVCDLVAHFVQDYHHIFLPCETVLIERQPPGGLCNVECALALLLRDKIQWVSPNAMHRHHGISHLDYDQRKVKTEEISDPWLREIDGYNTQERKHDMADAMCMVLYWCEPKRADILRRRRQDQLRKDLNFDRFRFNKNTE